MEIYVNGTLQVHEHRQITLSQGIITNIILMRAMCLI